MSGLPGERVALTGAAGFIGFHLAERLLREGHTVVGIDDLNAFYPVHHKERRLSRLMAHPGFAFHRLDVASLSPSVLVDVDRVVHLAAWPGVHASARQPERYVEANLVGFSRILEACRVLALPLLFASSSSVYGEVMPPMAPGGPMGPVKSLYAATKVANEAMAQAAAAQHGVMATAVRFFNVYGPRGRPDMAVHRFTAQIEAGERLQLHHAGRMSRDLTYVDDAVEAVMRLLGAPRPGFSVVNVGRGEPVDLFTLVAALEQALGRAAQIDRVALPDGEVVDSWADVTGLVERTGFRPSIGLDEGLRRFVTWYRAEVSPR
ncbi:MAG: NAD-dependent epimerase/dehydratase family protein [Myxococcota bacterium]